MHEPRVIPITQTTSLIFIFAGLQIVPSARLHKEMNFKSLGLIDMNCTIISSLCMFAIAKAGGGVWTLILGNVIKSLLRTILLFRKSQWSPIWHFNFTESKPFLSFGILVAIGRSVFYLQEKSDRFFAGRAWESGKLGLYTFALEIAQIPTEKITTIINNVTFPAFAKLQNDQAGFNKLYLNITKVTATLVLPLFVGGFVLGEDLIRLLFNEKWYPIIPLFRILCLSQIITSLNALNSFVHSAQGRPKWSLYYNIVSAICMAVAFFLAVPYGLYAITLPWVTVYLVLCLGWIYISIKKFGIPLSKYLVNIKHPFIATAIMAIILFILHSKSIFPMFSSKLFVYPVFVGLIMLVVVVYCGYFWFIDREFVFSLKKFIKRNPTAE
jgi:O-antigen/teichoic acid export membrane protein